MELKEASDKELDVWHHLMAAHARLKDCEPNKLHLWHGSITLLLKLSNRTRAYTWYIIYHLCTCISYHFILLQLYPDHDIRNIVEAAYKVDITDWPKFDGPGSETKIVHNVRPFKCIGKSAYEPSRDKSNKMACAPRKVSDQPGHPPSLISLCCALNG